MRSKLALLSILTMLVGLTACGSNNPAAPPSNSVSTTTTNVQTNTSGPAQPPADANLNAAGTPASPSSQPNEQQPAPATAIDACSLIENKEVTKIQGSPIKDTKNNKRAEGDFVMSQCFYTAEDFVRSVSLTVIQPNPSNPEKQPRQYFIEKFRGVEERSGSTGEREREREKEREREREKEKRETGEARERGREEEEEEGANIERVNGVGEAAYWVKTGPSAALYVLKKNQFIILSIGGGDPEPVKLQKTKSLAQRALKRLK